jgi:hypothetical protein
MASQTPQTHTPLRSLRPQQVNCRHLFSNRIEEPEPSEDELAATSFSYPTATSSHPDKQSDYNDLADITEDSETSEYELAMPTYMKPTPPKRPSEGSKKALKLPAIVRVHLVRSIVSRNRFQLSMVVET